MASGTTQWAPLWQFLWNDTPEDVTRIQRELDLPDQALVAYATLRHHGLPCPGPLRGSGAGRHHSLKRLAGRGLRRWARALEAGGGGDAPVARWLFRAAGGAPLPFLERKVARLLGGAGGGGPEDDSFEYYRDSNGQLRSQIHARAAPPARTAPGPTAAPEAAAAADMAAQEAAEDEQVDAVETAATSDEDDDSTRLPPLPPPFAMYAAES